MDERFWKLKRIPEGSETHRNSLERKRQSPTHKVFGTYGLEELDRFARIQAHDPEHAAQFEFRSLNSDKNHIIRFHEQGSPEQVNEIEELISEAVNDPSYLAKLEEVSGEKIENPTSVISILKKPDVPREFVAAILQAHKEKYGQRNEQVRELGEKLKVEFYNAVTKAVDEGFLDPETNLQRVQDRLSATEFFYIDPVSGGSHASVSRSNEGAIGISHEHMFKDAAEITRHTVFHELVHAALAGRLLAASFVEKYDQVMTHDNRKEGLRFDFERAPKGRKIGWMMGLNEGATEYIAQRLSGISSETAYGIQIQYMKVMNEKGVPLDEFVKAYQEDYKLDVKGEQRLPKLAKLLKSIRTSMGDDWYDKQIRPLKFDYGWGL